MLKLHIGRESEVHDSSMVSIVSCLLISNSFVNLSLGVSIAMKTHNQKLGGKKDVFHLTSVKS